MSKSSSTIGRLLALLLVLTAVIVGASATSPNARAAGAANPDLVGHCGINVQLILDESGSIQDAGAIGNVRTAASTFVNALADTGSKVGIIEFNTHARTPIPLTTVTAANTGPGSLFDNYINDLPANTNPATGYDPSEYFGDDRWTNWQESLESVGGSPPPLVVFVTDGNPTAYNDATGTHFGYGSVETTALAKAITAANAIKAAGGHMFGVGVGSLTLSRLQDVTGPDAYNGSNLATADYTTSNYTGLQAALKAIATELCKSSLTITKTVREASNGEYLPQAGWSFSGTVTTSPAPFRWLQPTPEADVASPSARSVTTDASGTASFQWRGSSADFTASIVINETVQMGYRLVDVKCMKNGTTEVVNQTTLPATVSGLLKDDAVTCAVRNERVTTAVTMRSFNVQRNAKGVLVSWRSAQEAGVLGYNVYRSARGVQTRVNTKLIVGRSTATGARYQLQDRTAHAGVPYRYRLQAVNLEGSRSWVGAAALR